jgi:hypothetical protein
MLRPYEPDNSTFCPPEYILYLKYLDEPKYADQEGLISRRFLRNTTSFRTSEIMTDFDLIIFYPRID